MRHFLGALRLWGDFYRRFDFFGAFKLQWFL